MPNEARLRRMKQGRWPYEAAPMGQFFFSATSFFDFSENPFISCIFLGFPS
ncbi:MAG: hypothetical protein II255_01550 [Ruminiclostridium sp.]|nr:hypothetical protein [Ruminiclostridium sp.]